MGHKYRSEALRDTAIAYKNQIATIGQLYRGEKVDWLIADVLRWDEIPEELVAECRSRRIKIALLSGVGHKSEAEEADLVWIQDDPSRVIIRDKFYKTPWYSRSRGKEIFRRSWWYVFGGATDSIGLIPAFVDSMSQRAYLVVTNLSPDYSRFKAFQIRGKLTRTTKGGPLLWQFPVAMIDDDDMISHMRIAKQACVAMGMTAWELAALRKNTYVFSVSEEHLRFAQNMEDMSLVKAYPKVGIPSKQEMADFLLYSNYPRWSEKYWPDGNGALRFLDALESPLCWTSRARDKSGIRRILI